MNPPTVKHESTTQPGLFYWAEANGGGGAGPIESYCVVAQAQGSDPIEAFDDWLAHWKDADEIARLLAAGKSLEGLDLISPS